MIKPRTITIQIDFDGSDEALGMVDDMLDAGVFQDAINEWATDRGVDVDITSALCSEPPRRTKRAS
jgi:hypothetical protein